MKQFLQTALFGSLITLTATASHAYEIEMGANAGILNPEHSSTGHTVGVSATYYLKSVRTNNMPYAEAAFTNKASNIKAQAEWNDMGNSKLNTYSLSGDYFFPNRLLVASAKLSRNNADNSSTLYGAELGYMPLNNVLVAIGATGYSSDRADGIDPSIRAKYLTQFAGRHLNLEGSVSFGDLDEYKLSADYYLDKSLSVGADYYQEQLNDHKVVGIKAEKFFNSNMSLGGRIGFGDVNHANYNTFGLNGKYRF